MKPLPFIQEELKTPLPTVYGCADYQAMKGQLKTIDHLLRESGMENQLVAEALAAWELRREGTSGKRSLQLARARKRRYLHVAVRSNILRHLFGHSPRELSVRIADSPLLQWFAEINFIGGVRPPSKSTLDRFGRDFTPAALEQAVKELVCAVSQPAEAKRLMDLDNPLRVDTAFADTTGAKINIHFPVDWVLLRDAIRTLVAGIFNIRRHGLKHRMPDPALLLRECNRLCIRITHSRRRKGGKKCRKAAFRQLKALARTVGDHGERYLTVLLRHHAEAELSAAEAALIAGRIRNILEQLPAAINQAHERVIGERQVANDQKILSLYEKDVHVLVRGKDGAEVEFGNGLLLVEQPDGLIIHWELMREQPPADSRLVEPLLKTLQQSYGPLVSLATDRGFSSAGNDRALQAAEIFNAICPKSPDVLRERTREPRFLELQRRRGQTEGRIGIFKNVFLNGRLLSKGFENQNLTVGWCILTHNLWVLARLALTAAARKRRAAA